MAYGLESCQCSQGPEDTATKACELCCKEPGDGKPCQSSFELNVQPLDVPDMFSKPGTPCNNYQGYCDVFQKCREVDPSGPLATLRKLLLSEESIANLKRFLMRYWYTVIFIVLGVFILMAIIIKVCGKKTPLVRSRRKRRRHNNQHQHGAEGLDPDNVQVHPTAVEAAVPLGKKVRKGEGRNKSKSKSRSRKSSGLRKVSKDRSSPQTSTTNTTPTSSHHEANMGNPGNAASVEDGVARAVRLAANLSNQLFVDLPPENNVTKAFVENQPQYEEIGEASRKSRNKAKKANKVRKHKSLSPEKRLATTLAQSMSSISKSFEKLDLVGRNRGSRPLQQPSSSRDAEQQQHKKRRRSRPNNSEQSKQQPQQKEVTIAKLGRFKFSVEMAKQFDEELSKAKGQTTHQGNSSNKKSEGQPPSSASNGGHKRKISSSSKPKKTSMSTNNEGQNEGQGLVTRKDSSVAKLPSIHVTNFNAQKDTAQLPFNAPSVIVSKKRKERPRRQESSPEKAKKSNGNQVGLDYRRSFGGHSEKFSRSISVPGPAPNLEEIQEFHSSQQPPRLRRSETMVQKAYEQPQAHSWVAEFDNHAYAKSPTTTNETNKRPQQQSRSSEVEQSLSLTSLNNEDEEEDESNANNVSFHCSSSTDSDLEVVTNKPHAPHPISRAKILETVGVIVNNATGGVAASNSSSLLLPPSSSSPSSSSSVSLSNGATSPNSFEASTDEPRLAFIGCETTASTLSSPLSGGSSASASASATTKRPLSLSERYPTSPSSSSSSSTSTSASDDLGGHGARGPQLKRDNAGDEDLDIISIITDGC